MTIHNNIKLLDIIKYPIVTDKTSRNIEENIYWFMVDRKATKIDIKQAIESIFNVKIQKINTLNQPPKRKRVGKFQGYTARYKKAVIKLYDDYSINLFTETD